jgi:protein-S-isoprenylcysteine O-methyltransferase Ste14
MASAPGRKRQFLQVAWTIGVWVGGLFAGAGTLRWPRGWFSVGLYVGAIAVSGLLLRRYNPELMAERAKRRLKEARSFDKVFFRFMLPLVSMQPVLAGLDVVRFRTSHLPEGLIWPGTIWFILGSALVSWVLLINPHAETTVRIQSDRGHTVITSGPYRWVRHPMYTGVFGLYLGMPLIWGSLWALATGAALCALFVWRTEMEDRTLQLELPGYTEYAAQTRYRLIPGIW